MTKPKTTVKTKAAPKVDAKVALESIGARFKEEQARKQSKAKTPRSEQDANVLQGTWMNRTIKNMDTRIDAYHWWNIHPDNDQGTGKVVPPEDIRVILDAFDK